MKGCTYRVQGKRYDSITGLYVEERGEPGWLGNYEIWNKDNNCRFFKKKVFAKKSEKTYCKDCRHYRSIGGDDY